MAKYRIQSKLFAGVFDPGTYNSMVNAAANNATPDAQRMLDGYSKKYAEEIAKYKNNTALTTIKPNTNIPTGTSTNPPNKVGVWQGLKNTYRNAGTMGKAGMIGAGILGTGLMVKGAMDMMGSSSKKEAAFSEDTNAALKEAAIYGTVGAGVLGTGYLVKRGVLGKTGKKTYENVSKRIKAIWNETKKPEIKVGETQTQTVRVKKKSKSGQTTTTTETTTKELGKPGKTTIETTAKKVKFTPEDWPKVLKVIKEKGMDPSNPAHRLAAAKIAGVKPFSVK
jgi:hypothetical protein